MIILRNKLFGKFDNLLAERQGISKELLRTRRAGFNDTDSVHDVINARSGKGITNGANVGTNTDLSSFNLKDKKGYSNRGVRDINESRLEQYKKAKNTPYKSSGRMRSNGSAYKKMTSDFSNGIFNDSCDAMRRSEQMRKSAYKKAPVKNNVPVPKRMGIESTPASGIIKPKATLPNPTNNKSSLGIGKRAMNLVKANPKTAIALGTGALLAGGIIAGKKSKKSNESAY